LQLADLISSCPAYRGRITYSILYNVTCSHDGGTTDGVQFHY
jgi:hypothetical protein